MRNLDLKDIATALADQSFEHRWTVNAKTGETLFWTTDTFTGKTTRPTWTRT